MPPSFTEQDSRLVLPVTSCVRVSIFLSLCFPFRRMGDKHTAPFPSGDPFPSDDVDVRAC